MPPVRAARDDPVVALGERGLSGAAKPADARARSRLAAWAVALVLCAGCARAVPRSLEELERMALLPIGQADASSGLGRGLNQVVGTDRELLVDLFEASRGDFEHWLGAPPAPYGMRGEAAHHASDRAAWPAYCDHVEASAFAARRGMRLPTVGEWLYAAAGPRGNRYPWGRQMQASVANTLELGLHRPLAVGTFENGRSAFGCYDMLGNVWEWVGSASRREGDASAAATVLGGSYLDNARELWDVRGGPWYFGEVLDARTRGAELGVRCVVDAETYLLAHAGEWAAHRGRVRDAGRQLGPAALPLIERLRARAGAPSALHWLAEGARP